VKKIIFVNFSAIVSILGMMLLVSCSGGGSSSSSGGGSDVYGATVQGVVTEFNGVAMMAPDTDQSRLSHALQFVSDRILSTANATAGVTVTIGGLTTTTGPDGSFSVKGVPPGPTTVVLIYEGVTATEIINIPANAEEVYLNNVQVQGNNIVIGRINIEVEDDTSSDDSISSDDSVSSDDNVSSDDGVSSDDNVSSDDGVSSDDSSSSSTS